MGLMMYSWLVYKQQAPKAQPVSSTKQATDIKKLLIHSVTSIHDLVPSLRKALLLGRTKTNRQMVGKFKYTSIGVEKRILKCFQMPLGLTVACSCYTKAAPRSVLSRILFVGSCPAGRSHCIACLALLPTSLDALQRPHPSLRHTLLLRQAGNTWQSGSASTWCGGGFRQARWVRMHGNSPITVQLDAQIPWLVTNYSEPSMLAPIGAPAAT